MQREVILQSAPEFDGLHIGALSFTYPPRKLFFTHTPICNQLLSNTSNTIGVDVRGLDVAKEHHRRSIQMMTTTWITTEMALAMMGSSSPTTGSTASSSMAPAPCSVSSPKSPASTTVTATSSDDVSLITPTPHSSTCSPNSCSSGCQRIATDNVTDTSCRYMFGRDTTDLKAKLSLMDARSPVPPITPPTAKLMSSSPCAVHSPVLGGTSVGVADEPPSLTDTALDGSCGQYLIASVNSSMERILGFSREEMRIRLGTHGWKLGNSFRLRYHTEVGCV
jgi:hypothetical protein